MHARVARVRVARVDVDMLSQERLAHVVYTVPPTGPVAPHIVGELAAQAVGPFVRL